MNTRQRWVRRTLMRATLCTVMGCAPMHVGGAHGYTRPPALVGAWIDVANSAPNDTSMWVLAADGNSAHARVHMVQDGNGAMRRERQETRDASWYFDGTLGDLAHQSICLSKRLGRFGAYCLAFTIDTLREGPGMTSWLSVRGFGGERDTSVRVFRAR